MTASVRRHLQRAALRIDGLSGGRLTRWARHVLGDARFATLTGAEGYVRRDAQGALPITAGGTVPDAAGRTYPLVLIVVTGATAAQVAQLVDAVAGAQAQGTAIRPVFVLDSGDFAPVRSHGYVVDSILSTSALERISPTEDYETYLRSQVALLARSYGAADIRQVRAKLGDGVAQLFSDER